MKNLFNMKKSLLILALLASILNIYAADPFREHRYDVFKVLPLNNENIVFIGNSITNMHEWWEAFGSNHKIVNRGVWGTFINETVDNIEAIAVGKPKKVFFMVGTNDLGKNGSRNIDDIIASTRIMVQRLKKVSPATEIYIQGILPSVYNRELNQLIETNERLKALCHNAGITYIDLWEDLFSLTTDYTHTLDGLHLKASGYDIWTKKIEEYVGSKSIYPDNCVTLQNTNGIANASYAMRATIFSTLPVNDGDILIIGDEMIHGGEWHELLQSNKIKSRGSGWGYTGPGLDVILKEIPLILNNNSGKCNPAKIFLYAGAGEANGSTPLADIKTSYNNIVNKIRELAPNSEIVLMSLQPTNNSSTNSNRVAPFNQMIKAIADSDTSISFLDIYTDFAQDNVASNKYFNGSYLRGMGYVKIAQKMAEVIANENIVALTDIEAEKNYRTFELRNTLSNAIAKAERIEEGNSVGEYSSESLANLHSLVERAYTLLKDGGSEEEFSSVGDNITAEIQAVLTNINQPQTSNADDAVWYKLYTPNRNSRYLSSNGTGKILTGKEDSNYASSQWKFVKREDGTLDIINRQDGGYINPNASHNSAISTTESSPANGWVLSYSNSPGLFIISSGATQINQTQSNLNWEIYNWSKNADGKDRDDSGCQYRIELVTTEPDEIVEENLINLSFSRGTTLNNSIVKVCDDNGDELSHITAKISASGASNWLTGNKAATDSILCVNINTNATTASAPISYTIDIEGINDSYNIHSIIFRSVALNSAGNWQGATEIRHCNFLCSYGTDKENLLTLPSINDESIMIANGGTKEIRFDIEEKETAEGALTIKLEIHKGNNNLGCFYGLTGVSLKVEEKNVSPTQIIEIDRNIPVEKSNKYDLMGRKVEHPTNGIYIIDGKVVYIK